MKLDELIKYCEEKAAGSKKIAEICKNARSCEDGYSVWEKSSEIYLQITDYLKLLKDIQSTGCCNICKSRGMCEYEPEVGQMVRYNCPFYKEERIIKSKYGKWIRHDTGHSIYYDCSICGCAAPCTETANAILWKLSKYCPDCGATMENRKMVEVKNDNF